MFLITSKYTDSFVKIYLSINLFQIYMKHKSYDRLIEKLNEDFSEILVY